MGKVRPNRVVAVLATVLSAAGAAALAQPASAPAGGPDLDYPSGMAFLSNGDIVMPDDGRTNGAHPIVVEVNPHTGARTLISGDGRGSGPELSSPYSVAVEASGDILVGAFDISTGYPALLRIDPATGNRAIVTGYGWAAGRR